MPDGMSAEEQAAVERFLATRGVTKVARGATSQPQPRFDQEEGRWYSVCGVTGERLSADEAKTRWNRQRARSVGSDVQRARSKAKTARQAAVARLAATMTQAELAAELGCAIGTVASDLKELGLSAKPASRAHVRVNPATVDDLLARNAKTRAETDAKIDAARQSGLSMADIARRTGCDPKTVSGAFKRHGWPKPARRLTETQKAAQSARWEADHATLDAEIEAVRHGAVSMREIERLIGRSYCAIVRAFQRNGWPKPGPAPAPSSEEYPSRGFQRPGTGSSTSDLRESVNAAGEGSHDSAKVGKRAPGTGRDRSAGDRESGWLSSSRAVATAAAQQKLPAAAAAPLELACASGDGSRVILDGGRAVRISIVDGSCGLTVGVRLSEADAARLVAALTGGAA